MKYNEIEIVKGVYSIANTKTGNTYVGISKNIYSRWEKHIYDLKNNNHHQHKLQEEFNKYSIDDFDFNILETFNNYKEYIAKQLEDEYILEFRSRGLGFEQLTNKEIGGNYVESNILKNKKIKKYNDKTNENFIIIPKKIILERDYLDSCGDKFTCILTELILSENKQGYVKFSIEDLITTLGIKPRSGEGRMNNQIKNIIEFMVKENILVTDIEINKIRINELIKCKLHVPYETNKDGKPINWFKVNVDDYLKILNDKSKLNKSTLTNIYFYILTRVHRRNAHVENIRIAEVFLENQDDMCGKLDISKATLNLYLNQLRELGLIFYGNMGKMVKNNTIREANNVYALDEEELKDGLNQSLYYWENQGWKLVSK
jgi:GIY-YIG catalytic domain